MAFQPTYNGKLINYILKVGVSSNRLFFFNERYAVIPSDEQAYQRSWRRDRIDIAIPNPAAHGYHQYC